MVSVLIDNHNYGKFIGEAIESVINQTYQDFELIIVDGDSSDDSRNVIMEYCNKYPDKITVVFKPTSGQAAAFNVGYNLSKGDIIAFLDSDDYWFPNKLEKIVEFHKKYKFIGHKTEVIYDGNKITKDKLKKKKVNKLESSKILKIYNQEDRPHLLKEYGYADTYELKTSSLSGTRDLFEKIFPLPEEYITFADHYFKILALYHDNIRIIDEDLSFYRIHGENALFKGNCKCMNYIIDLDYRAIGTVNKKLKKENLPLIPYIDINLYKKMLEVIGINFSIESGKEYALYGSGKYGKSVKILIEHFLNAKVKYFCDSNKNKWGLEINGIKIISPKELLEKRNEYEKILISSEWFREIADYLDEMGFEKNDYMYVEMGINTNYFIYKEVKEKLKKRKNINEKV